MQIPWGQGMICFGCAVFPACSIWTSRKIDAYSIFIERNKQRDLCLTLKTMLERLFDPPLRLRPSHSGTFSLLFTVEFPMEAVLTSEIGHYCY